MLGEVVAGRAGGNHAVVTQKHVVIDARCTMLFITLPVSIYEA